jgi:hypothetical protein
MSKELWASLPATTSEVHEELNLSERAKAVFVEPAYGFRVPGYGVDFEDSNAMGVSRFHRSLEQRCPDSATPKSRGDDERLDFAFDTLLD